MKTAILVDGGFYKKRAEVIYGKQTPEKMAENLISHCHKHLDHKGDKSSLYRIFYYDCPPLDKKVVHPFTKKTIDFSTKQSSIDARNFLDILRTTRKVALRLGKLTSSGSDYIIPPYTVKKLCAKKLQISDMKESDFKLNVRQKGVDMRIGLDIASLAYKHQVDRIVLIAGDSDFVPAAKLARREGIDFILDPMWNQISPDLEEHIDGLFSKCDKPKALARKVKKTKTK